MIEFQILLSTYVKMTYEEVADMLLRNGFKDYKEVKAELRGRIIFVQNQKPTFGTYIVFTQEQNL
jgi:hypothetical protein